MSVARMMVLAVVLCASLVGALRARTPLDTYSDPCPFGYGTNCGGGAIDPSTKAEVAGILEGILSNLNGKKALAQTAKKVIKVTLQAGSPHAVSANTKHALQSLIARLQKKIKQTSLAEALTEIISSDEPSMACKYFGKCGSGGSSGIDSQTKAQVANILQGILSNLSAHK